MSVNGSGSASFCFYELNTTFVSMNIFHSVFISEGKHFRKFLDQSKDLNPVEKAEFLEKDEVCLMLTLHPSNTAPVSHPTQILESLG